MTVDVQADLEALYSAIMARMTGKQVSQAGHKDKQASFASAPLKDMLHMYRQLWTPDCGLPDLKDVEQSSTRRGPPARGYFGGRC